MTVIIESYAAVSALEDIIALTNWVSFLSCVEQ
jgi:hypothetical protein